jgi:glycerol-3-phosphate acyltransferase PlsY
MVTAAAFRIVSAASIMAAISLPISLYLAQDEGGRSWEMGLFILLAIMVTYLHRTNIGRILNGTESRMGRKKA